MTKEERIKVMRKKKLKRKIRRGAYNVLLYVSEHPVRVAIPLIVAMLALIIHMQLFMNSLEAMEAGQMKAADAEIWQQEEIETERKLTMMDVYGCESLYGVYEYPYNTMSQDWGSDDVKGFYCHDITKKCKAAGGTMPTILQVFTYIVCNHAGVDYEMVFALIEQKSMCRWDAYVENGGSVGLMQVSEKWHADRMERMGVTDLQNPFWNVMVGVDYLKEIQNNLKGKVPEKDLQTYIIATYNHGSNGAEAHLKDAETVETVQRMQQLKEEKQKARETE